MNKLHRQRYNKNWESVSQRIRLERADDKCEICKVKNGRIIKRSKDGTWRYITAEEINFIEDYKIIHKTKHFPTLKKFKVTQIILTVAHLDHNEKNDYDTNLRCMCHRCHFLHDKQNNTFRFLQKKFISQLQLFILTLAI